MLQDDPDMTESEEEDSPELCSSVSGYKRLIALRAGKPKGGIKEALKIEIDNVRRLSLSEQALEKATESHGPDVVRYSPVSTWKLDLLIHLKFTNDLRFLKCFDGLTIMLSISFNRFTQKNFLRIYPKGTRFNSSNYKPMIGWIHGAQMVAFNMQVCY